MQNPNHKMLSFHVAEPAAELPLVFAYNGVVEAKSIVAKVLWYPEDSDNKSTLNLSWSEALMSHFTYLPRATGPGLKEGAIVKIDGPGTIQIEFLAWPSRKPLSDERICGVYIQALKSSSDQSYSTLQRIFEKGTNK